LDEHRVRRLLGIAGLVVIVAVVIIVSFAFVDKFGELLEDPQRIRDFIAVYGGWGYLVYGFLNIIQVLFAPIPGLVLTVSSGIIFGVFRGIIVSWLSVIVGGYGAMLITRLFGKRVLYYIMDEHAKRFESQISSRGVPLIFLLSLIPNPIGDGLFYLAGLTDVPFRILIPVIALARLPGIAISVFLGNVLLEFDTRRWIIGAVGFAIIVVAYFLFGKRLEALFSRIMNKLYPDWRS
jgi:uncharacterized membrane protein YdjX (TVP38/TMEM64 family)